MSENPSQSGFLKPGRAYAGVVYHVLALRAYSVIMFAALFANLGVKFFHAWRYDLLHEYPSWIFTDVAVLVTAEAVMALACYRRPTVAVLRSVIVLAVVICTWSVVNAAWVIRTGTQILPMEMKPLVRDPLNIAGIVLKNFASMPGTAAILLVPSAVTLAFFVSVFRRPPLPNYNPRRFRIRMAVSLTVALLGVLGDVSVSRLGSPHIAAAGLRFNCHARVFLSFLLPHYRSLGRDDFSHAARVLPRSEGFPTARRPDAVNHNIVIVVLEGVQYDCTSLAAAWGGIAPQPGPGKGGPTPCLAALAAQGAVCTNVRSIVTHTTKALFSLLTGRMPSASQDIAETVPVKQPYASLATILKQSLGFRTAFFQSAKGTFECRPGLVHNLGFDKFWAREDIGDPNQFVGYLGSDEFAMLEPITDWITSQDQPFLLVLMCSVTHDPYAVPEWFGAKPQSLIDRYLQAVSYTDRFIGALDVALTELNLANDTIFCVVGDHGEAFGEHRMMSHERIPFDEVMRVVLCLRAPFLIPPGTRITDPVGSVDLTPTLLSLLGFRIEQMNFDGVNVFAPIPPDRRVYFSGWMQQGPAGFVRGNKKFVYNPERDVVTLYQLDSDPLELAGLELPPGQTERLREEIVQWRKSTIFRPDPPDNGQRRLFGSWLCRWNGRVSTAKYVESQKTR
jgi:arylsulfatase A-like enzyme